MRQRPRPRLWAVAAPAVLTLVLALFLAPAWAWAAPGPFVEDLTWTELAAQIRAGRTTIIIPVGGVEQSGPYIALGKHDARVKFLAGKIAARLGDALVAPVVAYVPEGALSPPTGHMKFPGTITVPAAAFRQILESAAMSFALHGFRDIVLIGDHGGYQDDLKAVADDLDRRWASGPVRAHYIAQYYVAGQTTYVQALRRLGYSPAEIGEHAGLADASLTLAAAPSMVRPGRQAHPGLSDGVRGDSARASAQLGELGVDAIVSQSTDAIRAAVRRR